MGRYTISTKTHLSTAKIRSILERLKSFDLVETEGKSSGRRGTSITLAGMQVLDHINEYLTLVFQDEVYIPDGFLGYKYPNHCFAFLPNKYIPIAKKQALTIRDAAVRNGAQGAIILIWDDSLQKYVFPEDGNPLELPFDPAELIFYSCTKGVAVIGFGTSEGLVNAGTAAAALAFFNDELDFLSEYIE